MRSHIIKIDSKNDHVTVIVTVKGSKENIKLAIDHASSGLAIFKKFPGFIGGASHLSSSGSMLIQYLQWKDKRNYDKCMNDECWDQNPSTKVFMDLVKSDAIEMTVNTYIVVKNV